MTRAPLWRGRVLALLGILLCAFSLRSAVASLSPVIDQIAANFPVSSAVVGMIGTLPPVCYAVFGLLTPLLERMLGLERLTVIALGAIAAGLILRGLVTDSIGLLATTALVFAGVGVGNILMPPLVKKYFADRIGLMMTLYTTGMAVSTFLPPLVAVPIADAAGWRVSLGLWGIFAVAGIIPWCVMLLGGPSSRFAVPERPSSRFARSGAEDGGFAVPERGAQRRDEGRSGVEEGRSGHGEFVATGPIPMAPSNRALFRRLTRIPLVWALSVMFGTSSIMAYVSFAWLPKILTDISGVAPAVAGSLLSLFALIGLPASLLVPVLVVRLQATRPLFFVGVAGGMIGITGLLVAPLPALLPLWVASFGLVGLLFPLTLVLISIRSRTPESAVLLSSFVQSAGYVMASVFPVLVGILHEVTRGWTIPLIVVAAVLVASIPAGIVSGRRVTVEDEWERRYGRW